LNHDPIDYKKSGVDVQAGDDLVDWLNSDDSTNSLPENSEKHQIQKQLSSRIQSGIGGFAALFNAHFDDIKNPLLVSCTDGVGTKVKVASYFSDYSTVGQDLVAMCTNDLICTGGRPLFFLDYYATGKLHLPDAKQFLTSVKKACLDSEVVLIGGETAEMPGVYQPRDFDCAGFAVGVVDRDATWGAHRVQSGDCLIGVQSSGFHSNGFSLIRKIFEGQFDQYKQWLLEPTRLYIKAAREMKNKSVVHAAAHITGGGLENIPRVLKENQKAILKRWDFPECFQFVKEKSGLSDQEMMNTLNCGLGFVFIVPAEQKMNAIEILKAASYEAFDLGVVTNKKQSQEPSFEFE